MADESSERSLGIRIQTLSVILALVGILASAYFALRSEHKKEITVLLNDARSLINSGNVRSNAKLEVRIGDRTVHDPWILSGDVVNSGTLPIEARDIEQPIRITFAHGKILSVDVSSQSGIAASAMIDGDAMVLSHKLLNPTDRISFDVLFDGKPEKPTPTFRISGIVSPILRSTAVELRQPRPNFSKAVMPIAAAVLGFLLAVATMTSLYQWFSAPIRKYLGYDPKDDLTARLKGLTPDKSLQEVVPVDQISRTLHSFFPSSTKLVAVDNDAELQSVLTSNAPSAVFETLGLSPIAATAMLTTSIRSRYRDLLARALYLELPSTLDNLAREEMLKDEGSLSTTEMHARAVQIADEYRYGRKYLYHAFREAAPSFILLAVLILMVIYVDWSSFLQT